MPVKKITSDDSGSKSVKRRKTGLGMGLDALFPDMGFRGESIPDFFECDIDRIRPNPFQPRRHFPENEMAELAESVRTQGILQPLLVRQSGDEFELVAGERRLRAAKLAGLFKIPVLLKDIPDDSLLELSIIENVQRQDLNPIEEAEAYQRLLEEFGLTQEKIAERVGKNRSTVANFIRLNQLSPDIKASVRDGLLSMGHARAILGAETTALQREAWKLVILKELTVRETEKLVQRLNSARKQTKEAETSVADDKIHFESVARDLSRRFGTRVQIRRRGKKGKLEFEFYSDEDLDRLLGLIRTT
jgi:ParB family transcriptional regulator, chromosome partitioning protein